jgi:hypothetical protein
MNSLRFFILALCIVSCAQIKKSETASASTIDSIAADSMLTEQIEENTSEEGSYEDDEEDCVFDTSTYKLTSEALREYDKNILFRWDKEEANAFVKLNEVDSLILHIGGCSHFGYSATFITDSSRFHDRDYLIQKTKWMAEHFFSNGFDEKYVTSIENKLFKLEESSRADFLDYSIIDPDTAITDHVYLGWSFEKIGAKTRIVLDGYIN